MGILWWFYGDFIGFKGGLVGLNHGLMGFNCDLRLFNGIKSGKVWDIAKVSNGIN